MKKLIILFLMFNVLTAFADYTCTAYFQNSHIKTYTNVESIKMNDYYALLVINEEYMYFYHVPMVCKLNIKK